MEEINNIVKIDQQEKSMNENNNIVEKINIEKETKGDDKEKSPIPNKRYKDNEVESILKRNPLEELKLIKEKIKNENSKIKEINSQLDKINQNNNRHSKRRNGENKDEIDKSLSNVTIKKRNNIFIPTNIKVSSSQQIGNNNLLSSNPSINAIYQKMENLKKIKLIREFWPWKNK